MLTVKRRLFIGLLVAIVYSLAIAAVAAHADPVAPSGMYACHEVYRGGLGYRIINDPAFALVAAIIGVLVLMLAPDVQP